MVTFETKCYENDWNFILKGNYLDKMIKRCNYNFQEKVLYINNVNNLEKVCRYAEKKIKKGVIDKYIIVDEYADDALKFFNINKDSFIGGYYYSIAELVSIYLCKTKYLLHFSGDTRMVKNKINWIEKSIKILEENPQIIVSNPTWNNNYNQVKKESFDEMKDFYISYGFSDHCYLVRSDDFKKQIYGEKHPISERYPKYGGELFEKRVDSYMRNKNLVRIVSKEVSTKHQNIPKKDFDKILRKIELTLLFK